MAAIRDGPYWPCYQNSMFTGHSQAVYGGTFNQTNVLATQRAFEYLFHMISPTASHNSLQQFDRPKCHPNTRVAVIKKIQDWILGNTDILPVMWLHGAAGAGKTAISHTIAAWCEEQKLLLASFFFFRADPTRKHIKPLIATLAYGITLSVPAMRPFVERAVELDPNIFSRRLEVQLVKLVLEPFECVSRAGASHTLPHVIVIDGLDECVDPVEQKALLWLLTSALGDRMPGWRVLVSSRAELAISNLFNNAPLMGISTRIALDSSEYKSGDDIRRFLVDAFDVIKQIHSRRMYIPFDWPRSDTIDKLVQKSSGQFIYAKTVIKYVESEYHSPCRRLETLLGIREAPSDGHDLPFVELDFLYTHILSSTRVADVETTCRVVALCISYHDINWWGFDWRGFERTEELAVPDGLEFIGDIMNKDEEELSLILSELGSIISLDDDCNWFKVLHASLADFLFDPVRSHLYVNRGSLNAQIACHFLQRFADEPSYPNLHCILNVLSETNMTVTPELAGCLFKLDILSIRQIAADSKSNLGSVEVVLLVLRILKDLALLYENGDATYQRHASIFDQWFACGAADYLQKSPGLTSVIATLSMPSLYIIFSKLGTGEDEQYDRDHLQLRSADLICLPYVIAELPETEALLMDGKANATALLLLVKAIVADSWWIPLGNVHPGGNVAFYYVLEGLPTLLERAAESSDLLSVLPSGSIIILEEYAVHFPDKWNAVRVAIKSYLERNGVSVSAFYDITSSEPSWGSDIDFVNPSLLDLGRESTYAHDGTYFIGPSPYGWTDKRWEIIHQGCDFATWNKFVMILNQDVPSAQQAST